VPAAASSAISAAAKIAGNSNLTVFIDNGQVEVRQAAVPERPPQFALLQLIAAGICNTDLELQRGYYNFQGIPGHEFVARVVACDNPFFLNKRVVGEINLVCGHCDFCAQKLGRHCRHRTVLGILGHPGAFSRYFTLPEANLHIVPDSISDEQAIFTEPLAAACEILDQVDFEPGANVAVIGDGKLGLLITQVLLAQGLQVVLHGRHDAKLALARAAGASIATQPEKLAYQYVVECSGSAKGLSAAIEMTQPRGTIILKSTVHDSVSLDMAPVIVNEISLVGSRCGRFEPALQLLRDNRVNVTSLIAERFPLHEAPQAFARTAERGALKVLLDTD
jgi:threonine dehydrogenase-like Zn-dependent dehydrogenase